MKKSWCMMHVFYDGRYHQRFPDNGTEYLAQRKKFIEAATLTKKPVVVCSLFSPLLGETRVMQLDKYNVDGSITAEGIWEW